jgi:hypothetical protein
MTKSSENLVWWKKREARLIAAARVPRAAMENVRSDPMPDFGDTAEALSQISIAPRR